MCDAIIIIIIFFAIVINDDKIFFRNSIIKLVINVQYISLGVI